MWLTFAAQASVRDDLAAVLREHQIKSLELLTWLIQFGQRTGEIRGDLDPAEEANALHALADGITVQVAVGQATRTATRRLVNHATDHLWAS